MDVLANPEYSGSRTIRVKKWQGTTDLQNIFTAPNRIALHMTSVFMICTLIDNRQEPINVQEFVQLL